MVIILGMFALCWLPYVVMFIVVQFWDTRQSDYIRRVSLIPGLFTDTETWNTGKLSKQLWKHCFTEVIKIQFRQLVRELFQWYLKNKAFMYFVFEMRKINGKNIIIHVIKTNWLHSFSLYKVVNLSMQSGRYFRD